LASNCPSALARDQLAIRFEDQPQSIFEVTASFCQRATLSVGAGDFFNEGDIPASFFVITAVKWRSMPEPLKSAYAI
jgi:hypothetical protein